MNMGEVWTPPIKKSRALRVNKLRIDLERRTAREQKGFGGESPNQTVSINPKEPYLHVELGSRRCTGLVDSGSGVTLIKESVFQALEDGLKIRTVPSSRVYDASGTLVDNLGTYFLRAKFLGTAIQIPVIVVRDTMAFRQDLLLGTDVLKTHGIKINFNSDTVKIRGNEEIFPLHYGSEKRIRIINRVARKTIPKLRSSRSYLLTPGDACMVQCNVRNSKNEPFLLTPFKGFEKHVDQGMIKTSERGQCWVIALNETNADVELRKGTVIGSLKPIGSIIEREGAMDLVHNIDAEGAQVRWSEGSDLLSKREFLDSSIKCEQRYKDKIRNILIKYIGIVSLPGEPLGRTELMELDLKVKEGTKPISVPPYKIPKSKESIMNKEIEDLLEQGVVTPSRSPWAFPAILVSKADKSWRLCVDYRKLNLVLEDDRFPLPNIQDLIMDLHGAKFYTRIDLKQAFHQVPLSKETKQLTAFRTKDHNLEFNVCPFGLKCMPGFFSRLMSIVFRDIKNKVKVETYLDDIIVSSPDAKTHLHDIEEVFKCLQKANLKIKLKKCEFFRSETDFLGFKIGTSGYSPQKPKIEAITKFPTPKSVTQVRSFLGLVGYYRCFIEGFAELAKPLIDLTRKDRPFVWSEDAEKSFADLRAILSSDQILIYPNFDEEFIVETDASCKGLGATIGQKRNGKVLPITFASRVLSKSELNYSATELEALAVIWALRKHRYILLGQRISVIVDHRPLVELFKNTLPPGRLSRWALTIQEYCPKFYYRPGKQNSVPDALSRNPIEVEKDDQEDLMNISELIQENIIESQEVPIWTLDELREAQRIDPFFAQIFKDIQSGKKEARPGYQLRNLILHYEDKFPPSHCRANEARIRVVVPTSLATRVVEMYHESQCTGHPNGEDIKYRIQSRYLIKNLGELVENIDCHLCNKRRRVNTKKAPISKYPVITCPFEQLHFDILGPLPMTKEGYKYIIVYVDRFTRYSIIDKLRDRTATSVARSLIEKVICIFTTPSVLLSDNALEFVSKLLKAICDSYKIKRSTITSYHPAANGLAEATVKRVLTILRKLINTQQNNWDLLCPLVMKALNTAYHPAVRDSPHFLVFLQDSKHPFEKDGSIESQQSKDDFVETQLELRRRIFEVVKKNLEDEAERFTSKYNATAIESQIRPGNRVYIKKRDFKNVPKRKLADIYTGPYRVLEDLKFSRFKLGHIDKKEEIVVHADDLKKVREPVKVERPRKPVETSKQKRLILIPQADKTPTQAAATENKTPEGEQHQYRLRPRKLINYKL